MPTVMDRMALTAHNFNLFTTNHYMHAYIKAF